MNLEIGEYHARDRWTFKRLDGGAVRVRRYDDLGMVVAEITVTPEMWASIVATVSARDESHETYREALEAHQRGAK